MHPEDLKFPALFHEGRVYFLQRSESHTGSYFGGPFDGRIQTGVIRKPRLHHIASINGRCFKPLFSRVGGGAIELLYGITHEACHLQYTNERGIQLLKIEPKTAKTDWPYPNYPPYLPYFPLELKESRDCSFEEFCELSCQRLKNPGPTEVVIIIPSSPVLGISMWGPTGDLENVQIVFRYDMKTCVVEGFNQCG